MKIESYKVRGKTKYRFRAYVGLDPLTGDPIRVRGSGYDTKKEAQLACAELVARKRPAKASDATYRQMYDLWMETYKLTVKNSTLKRTEQIFRDHILPSFGKQKIADIDPIQCQQWTNNQAKESVDFNIRYSYMSKIFDFAIRQGIIDKNPAALIERPKRKRVARSKKAEMKFYTREELQLFLSLCQSKLPHMWYVFFRLLAYTGMRRGEALVLKWEDLDEEAHTIRINKTVTHGKQGAYISDTPKTEKSNRTILLDDTTLQLLLSLDHTSSFIFHNRKGNYPTPSMVVRMMHKAVDGSDLRYISPHGLRHTHCSLLFSAGVSIPEVQDRLGHSDVKTTLDVYNHVYQSDKADALDRFLTFMDPESRA